MAELALGIVGIAGTVDACIKFGKVLVQAYKDYGQADAVVGELSVRIQICWSRLHDIYSLGVCLLEIGLWKSLVDYDGGDVAQISNTLQATGGPSEHVQPEAVKEKPISLSRNQLRALMCYTKQWKKQ
ncbi:hypothetical protein FOVSG1_011295 [Fusarium oxysporum f. sp. vasinfectum]